MRHTSVFRGLIALCIIGGWLAGAVASAAIFGEDLSTGAGPAVTTIGRPENPATFMTSDVVNAMDSSNSFNSGYLLQGRDGSVVHLTSAAAWSRQDLTGGALNSSGAGHEGFRPAGASLSDRILAGLDSPVVVRARGLGLVAEARPDSTSLSSILPMLAVVIFCAWFGLYFWRCLHPCNGLPKHRTPRGFFKAGR